MRRGIAAVVLLASACSGSAGDGSRTVVASVYPLAWAAQRLAAEGWRVVDLTPPGAEAHDIELTLEQRAQLDDADVIVHVGDIGFQPQVEAAAAESGARVVAVDEIVELRTGHDDEEGAHEEASLDPHVWLDATRFVDVVDAIAAALGEVDPRSRADVGQAAGELRSDLAETDREYGDALAGCASRTMVVSHEAFGYLAERYRLEQVGLEELSPEAEPSVAALGEAGELLASGEAAAVFYEADPESEDVARTVAADAGVPALPLHTLESRPADGDYLSVMEENLRSLREGLGCR